MSIYEVLKMNESLMRMLRRNGVDASTIDYIEAYEAYQEMTAQNLKKEYVYAEISQRYGLSKSTIYRLVKHMEGEISLTETQK